MQKSSGNFGNVCGFHLFLPPHRRVLLTWNNSQHEAALREGSHTRLNDIYMRLANSVWKKKLTSNRSLFPNCEWTQTSYSDNFIIGINEDNRRCGHRCPAICGVKEIRFGSKRGFMERKNSSRTYLLK